MAFSLGSKHTPEARAKIRAARIGTKRTPETLAKMRASALGKKHTAEARAKMRASHLGKSVKWKPVVEYSGAHYRMGKVTGSCRCGALAQEWALDPATPPERLLTSQESTKEGLLYSLTPSDYRPSCVGCNQREGGKR